MSAPARMAALVAVLLGGVGIAAHAHTFVWQVTDEDNTVYLAGSIHLLPPDAYPLPEPFHDAFADAEIVAFETDIQRLRSSEVQTRLFHAARYDHGGLAAHLSDQVLTELIDVLDDIGLSFSAMRKFRPWFVASAIELHAFRSAGFKKTLGVDVHFYDKAQKRVRKPSRLNRSGSICNSSRKCPERCNKAICAPR